MYASGVIGPLVAMTEATSWRCSAMDSLIQVFEASRPSAMTVSLTFGAPAS